MANVQELKDGLLEIKELATEINSQFDGVVTKIDALQEQVASGSGVTLEDLQELQNTVQDIRTPLSALNEKQDLELDEEDPSQL